jgi:COMPASS component SWD2
MIDDYQIAAIVNGDDQVVDSCFHSEGRMLVTATKDSIQLIDSLSGESKKKLNTKTHGNQNVVFTHHEFCVLASSRKTNNDIRYLSMYDNRYLRFFKGHQTQVTSLAMSPVDDCFLSSSADRAVCLWSLASPAPVARLTLPEGAVNPKVAYTHDGLLFGVMVKNTATGSNCIRLFDARSYDKGPFQQLRPSSQRLERALKTSNPSLEPAVVQRCLASAWESFSFSPDDTRALVSTACGMLISLDAFSDDGDPVVFFSDESRPRPPSGQGQGQGQRALGCCCTPDSKHVLAGTEDKKVLVYDLATGRAVGELPGEHVAPVTSVRCNPKYEVIATSGINTMLWLKSSLFAAGGRPAAV